MAEGQFADGAATPYTQKDFRFTTAGGALYAIELAASDAGEYVIDSLGEQDASRQANFHGIIRDVRVLGTDEAPRWERDARGLHIHTGFRSDMPVTFRLRID